MHVNRSGRLARLFIIIGLICFVLVGLIIRPASALTANPAAVCAGLDCTVTFGPSDGVYEWVAPSGSSKVWVQLEGSQDVVSGVCGDSVIATFKVAPSGLYFLVGDAIELRSSIAVDSLLADAQSGAYLATLGRPDPSMMVPDQMTPTFISFVRHGGAPAGVGHAIVHYKQAAVQSPAPVVTPAPTPSPTASPTPTNAPTPEPAAVLPSPPSDTPTKMPTSEPTPEQTTEPPTVESVAVAAAPVVESPRTPVVTENPVSENPAPGTTASVTEDADSVLVTPYLQVATDATVKVVAIRKEVPSRQRVIQVFSNPRAIEPEKFHPTSEIPTEIKAESSSRAWISTSLEIAAVALGGVGVILGIQSARRKKLAAHRKRFGLVKAFS